jgi:hypothetical protein
MINKFPHVAARWRAKKNKYQHIVGGGGGGRLKNSALKGEAIYVLAHSRTVSHALF